ncbi:MAG: lysophospholipid acyltransferase family protein [Thermodesulfobacteriota bacterium]
MRKLFFNLYFWLAFSVVTLAGVTLIPVIVLVTAFIPGRSSGSATRRAIRLYGWVLVCIVPFGALVRVEKKGRKLHCPAIFVANHNSAIDPYLFGALPIENCFITSWPFKIPIYGPLMRLAGYINAEEGWTMLREKGEKRLAGGTSLTIWPEGHRSRNGRLGRFKKGAFALAVQTGYPVVPVSILGSGTVLSPGERLLNPGRVKLIIHEPVYPASHGDEQQRVSALRNEVRQIIEKSLRANHHFSAAAETGQNSKEFAVSDCHGSRQHGPV